MDWHFLLQILMLLGAAVVLGAVAERLRQSAIVGYLLAGTLVAPWITHDAAVGGLAELGVALLLFSIGLEFSWQRLKRLGGPALIGGGFQIVLTLACFAGIVFGAGSAVGEAIAFGAVIALSSTAVVLRTLTGRGEIDSVHGRTSLGILLMQDIAVVPLVLLVDSMGSVGGGVGPVVWTLIKEVFFAGLLVAAFILIAQYVLPVVLMSRTLTRNREIPILLAVVAALGSAWVSHTLGLSPALGAFVAGVVLGESPLATQIRADVGALKTLFVTLFFSSIGMLADVGWIVQNAAMLLAVVAAVIVGKALIVWAIGRRLHMAHRHAIAAGLCLAQVGEFSFVILGESTELIGQQMQQLLVSVTVVTLLVTPYLIALAPRIGGGVERWLRRRGWAGPATVDAPTMGDALSGHVIVIGFGPAGREVAEALEARGAAVLVIDLNARTVMEARHAGRRALAGDAANADILEHAHVGSAREVVVTLPDHRAAIQVIRQVRAIAPQTRIIARSRYNIYAGEMEAAGAHVVVPEETSVGEMLVVEVNKAF